MPDSAEPVPARNTTANALYTEKLWPGFWIWVVVAGLSGAGILVFAPISLGAGITAALVLFTIMAVLLILSTPTIAVTSESLQVGRARIGRRHVGTVEAFRKAEATAERGPRLNGLAYLCFRGWIDAVVKIEITDPDDRTPYWLTSSRHPDELVAALASRTGT